MADSAPQSVQPKRSSVTMFMQRLFSTGTKKMSVSEDDPELKLFKQLQLNGRRHTVAVNAREKRASKTDVGLCTPTNIARRGKPKDDGAVPVSHGVKATRGRRPKPPRQFLVGHATAMSGSFKRRSLKGKKPVVVDANVPLVFPTTPETILEYHKQRPFLDQNEEWLIVELNQFECLVDSLDIVRVIAKHSKFFEVEPDELWEEFFEFVDEVPSYDEVINYDVWQEFRYKRYAC